MKNQITLFINGIEHHVHGEDVFMTLADYLRYRRSKTGTKIVCAEGDCGACTVLVKKLNKNGQYQTINSCIGQVFQFHGHHIITVEGLKYKSALHPVQEAMVDNHGAQCGYCTPGIVCSMAKLAADAKNKNISITSQKVKNYLTGNLCRCTGYAPIIEAGMKIDLEKVKAFEEQYPIKNFSTKDSIGVELENKSLFMPTTLVEAIDFKNTFPESKLISGSSDLGVLKNKQKWKINKILHLGLIDECKKIKSTKEQFEIGCSASLQDVEEKLADDFPEFSRLLHLFASPQIKSAGTLVGNVANGSPIGDTIPFLIVADARLELISADGVREVSLKLFYKGYKQFDLRPNEIIAKIIIPKTQDNFKLYKVSMRKDLDISAVTFAARTSIEDGILNSFNLAVGGVGPTVVEVPEVVKVLKDKVITEQLVKTAASKLRDQVKPLSDVRGSAKFRKQLCYNLMIKCFRELM
jgi:xanthine dehydrogenase small subunit